MDDRERPTEQEYERKAVAEGDLALIEDLPDPESDQARQTERRSGEQQPGDDQGLPT